MAPAIPSKNHSSAPKFDGKAGSLSMFLDDVKQLAIASELTPKQTIEWAIRYAPSSDENELWSSLDSAKGDSWDEFKRELHTLYPGSTGERKYSVTDLEMLTEKQATGSITNSEQFGTYYRAFSKVSRYLREKGKLTDREVSAQFMRGFDYAFRVQVRAQLRAKNPKHHSDDLYALTQICDAALFILSCNHDDSGITAPSNEVVAPTIKKEFYDMSAASPVYQNTGINLSALALELMKHMNISQVQPSVQPVQHVNSLTNQNIPNNPRPRSYDCSFCSDPSHYQNACPKAAEYIQKGLCMRNSKNFIVMPNGVRVSPRMFPGKNIMERIDNWHKTNAPSISKVSSNFVGNDGEYIWELPEDTNSCDEDNIMPPTEREIEDLKLMETLIESTQKKVDETKRKIVASMQTQKGPVTRNMAKNNASPNFAKDKQVPKADSGPAGKLTGPQYKYMTPIEDTKIVERIVERALDAPITITERELLAIAPEVRKHVKELITTKRTAGLFIQEEAGVHIHGTALIAALPPSKEGIIVSNHTEELRALDFNIGDLTVEGVMDEGSQIIGLHKDIWEKLAVPIRSDHIMVMESSNKTTDKTVGLIQDLKVSVGGYDFYVQVQVVQDAPYELLVGHPFMSLTKLVTRHFEDGNSEVTMIDPNTGAMITMPTRPRNRRPSQIERNVGF